MIIKYLQLKKRKRYTNFLKTNLIYMANKKCKIMQSGDICVPNVWNYNSKKGILIVYGKVKIENPIKTNII